MRSRKSRFKTFKKISAFNSVRKYFNADKAPEGPELHPFPADPRGPHRQGQGPRQGRRHLHLQDADGRGDALPGQLQLSGRAGEALHHPLLGSRRRRLPVLRPTTPVRSSARRSRASSRCRSRTSAPSTATWSGCRCARTPSPSWTSDAQGGASRWPHRSSRCRANPSQASDSAYVNKVPARRTSPAGLKLRVHRQVAVSASIKPAAHPAAGFFLSSGGDGGSDPDDASIRL